MQQHRRAHPLPCLLLGNMGMPTGRAWERPAPSLEGPAGQTGGQGCALASPGVGALFMGPSPPGHSSRPLASCSLSSFRGHPPALPWSRSGREKGRVPIWPSPSGAGALLVQYGHLLGVPGTPMGLGLPGDCRWDWRADSMATPWIPGPLSAAQGCCDEAWGWRRQSLRAVGNGGGGASPWTLCSVT